jgi:hypothetical protein
MATKKSTAAAGAPAKKPVVRRRRKVTEEMIRERAYYLSMSGPGSPEDHWLTAERELVVV